jgi:hypothetical protein
MIGYRRLFTKYESHWDKMRMYYQKGLILRPENYEDLRWQHSQLRSSNLDRFINHENEDLNHLLNRFYFKYPDVKYAIARNVPGAVGKGPKSPAVSFVEKQMKLMENGFSESKAFEIVEKKMSDKLQKQRDENRILRGFALNNRARSYLNYSQQLAEIEGRAKVQQLDRDLNKYLYQEQRWDDLALDYGTLNENQKKLIEDRGHIISEKFKNLDYTRETLEEYFSQYAHTKRAEYPIHPKNYEPVLYQIIKDPNDMNERESLVDIQHGFVRRTEFLLKAHKHRATLTDGLKGLSDGELIQKMREVPTRIKKNAKSLVKKLEKLNVTLKEDGSVDYSKVPYEHVVRSLQNIDSIIRIALMQKDLEFEYPQHAEKLKIKGDILKIINSEEVKLQKMKEEQEVKEKADPELNYEQYFESLTSDNVRDISFSRQYQRQASKKKENDLIFEKDLDERSQMFLEDDYEREKRLKELWLDLKRKNVIGGPDARTTNEQLDLQEKIVDKIRDVRWKIDQELVKKSIDPLFKKAYNR